MSDWPKHEHETRPWRQMQRAGTREDRMFSEVTVTLPPRIGSLTVPVDVVLAGEIDAAEAEIRQLDDVHGAQLEALGLLLLRTESVASSKIEFVEASVDDYARALHGTRANPSAVSMVAATTALDALITATDHAGHIELGAVQAAHESLMRDEPGERSYAGQLRDMQNWIGGSDYSPRNALYVPPPPEMLGDYMGDLFQFANRDDMPALAQAAVAHAQFESIHPFTDGNGRIGRALINAILRRRRVTSRLVVPLASALVAHRDRYFDLLNAYRDADVRPLISSFAAASLVAASESRVTARRLAEIPGEWRDLIGPVRAASAAAGLLTLLPTRPVVSAEDVSVGLGAPLSSAYAAISRLNEAGVLRPLTTRRRDQVWGAALILDELDDLGARIARATS